MGGLRNDRYDLTRYDALKRTAVKFGVGRYLGKSGVPEFARYQFDEPAPKPTPETKPAPAPKNGAKVSTGRALYDSAEKYGTDLGVDLVGELIAFGRSHGIRAKVVDWGQAEIEQGAAFLRDLATKIKADRKQPAPR